MDGWWHEMKLIRIILEKSLADRWFEPKINGNATYWTIPLEANSRHKNKHTHTLRDPRLKTKRLDLLWH